jgi:hypothetical protein
MRERYKLLGQILFVYGIAFLTPFGSVTLSYIRGEDISNSHIWQAILLALIGLMIHVASYIFLRIKSKARK